MLFVSGGLYSKVHFIDVKLMVYSTFGAYAGSRLSQEDINWDITF